MSQSGLMDAGEERGTAVTPPRSQSAAPTPAGFNLGLLGALGQRGKGQSEEVAVAAGYVHLNARAHKKGSLPSWFVYASSSLD